MMFVTYSNNTKFLNFPNNDKQQINIRNIDYILSPNKHLINKYINDNLITDIDCLNKLFEKNFIYAIKKNEKVLGLIIFVYNTDIKAETVNLKYLHFENNSFCFNFIDMLFKRGVKKILINDIQKDCLAIFKNTKINCYYIENQNIYILTNSNVLDFFKINEENYKNNNKYKNDITGYLYIIKEREFNKTNENIYKIGCTNDIIKRYKQYPKDSVIIYSILCKNYREIEKKWIKKLNKNINLIKRKDIGREYFEGNYFNIINELTELISF